MNKAVCWEGQCRWSTELRLGAFARRARDVWLVVMAVELELRTQVTTKCRSTMDDKLTVPLIYSLNGVLDCYFREL